MSLSERVHFADTYYRPSWDGGDVQRPLCHAGRLGFQQADLLTSHEARVDCPMCRRKLNSRAEGEAHA